MSWDFNRGRIVEKCDTCGQFVSYDDEDARVDEVRIWSEPAAVTEELICGRCVRKEKGPAARCVPALD